MAPASEALSQGMTHVRSCMHGSSHVSSVCNVHDVHSRRSRSLTVTLRTPGTFDLNVCRSSHEGVAEDWVSQLLMRVDGGSFSNGAILHPGCINQEHGEHSVSEKAVSDNFGDWLCFRLKTDATKPPVW